MYRITPRLSVGAGWVERLAFDKVRFQPNVERVYGPRAAFQFLWTKGINFRFPPELFNTDVPPQLVTNPSDNGNREWIWSAFIGIKKDFKFIKISKEKLRHFIINMIQATRAPIRIGFQ